MLHAQFRDTISNSFIHRGKVLQPTHRLLDGGNLSVKDMHAFYESYARAVLREENVYVVELKTEPVFKMFFDADIHSTEVLDDEWCERFAKYIMGAVSELFSESIDLSQMTMIVCKADPKATKKNSVECMKYGLHAVFTTLHVNREMAVRIRNAVVQKLSNNMVCNGPTRWEDDIDEVVYGANGLRMPFSRKMMRCKCSLKDRDSCEQCLGKGTRDEGRPYLPYFKIDGNMRIQQYDVTSYQDVLDFVNESSIRSSQVLPSHQFNAMPPCWFEDPDVLDVVIVKKDSKRRRQLTEGYKAVESALQDKMPLSQSDIQEISTMIQKLVKKRVLPKEYKNVEITSAFSFCNNGIRSNIICRLNSQFCMNIGREHSTNTVYLELNTNVQKGFLRCYCRCETTEGRRTTDFKGNLVKCKDYKSQSIDIKDLKLSSMCNVADRPKKRVIAML
jgi:hypothetical protein